MIRIAQQSGHKLQTHCWRRWVIVAVLSFCIFTPVRQTKAAPLTFAFDANITRVQGDAGSLNLPFPLQVGQPITGLYSFLSEEDLLDIFLHPVLKQGIVALKIGGIKIEALTNIGTLNDGGFVDINDPPPFPNSSLSLGYISPTDVVPGWGGYIENNPWGVGLGLVGPEGTIVQPGDVLNCDVWNQLTSLRRLDLRFGYPNTVSVQATVGNFSAVPEPASVCVIYSAVAIALSCIRVGRNLTATRLCAARRI